MKTIIRKINTLTNEIVSETTVENKVATENAHINGYKYTSVTTDFSGNRINKNDNCDVIYVYTRKNSKYVYHMITSWGVINVSEKATEETRSTEAQPTTEEKDTNSEYPAKFVEEHTELTTEKENPTKKNLNSVYGMLDEKFETEILDKEEFEQRIGMTYTQYVRCKKSEKYSELYPMSRSIATGHSHEHKQSRTI